MTIEQKIAELMAESEKFESAALNEDAPTGLPKQSGALAPEGSHFVAPKYSQNNDNKLASDSELSDDENKKALAALNKKKAELAKDVKQESFDMTDDVAALVEGENLSEEFKVKAATIFEAAVLSRVAAEKAKLDEQYAESFDEQLEEAVAIEVEGLIEQVDGYLSYMAEQWMTDNEIALESSLKTDILEGFVSGLKGLFEEHYIDVPEGATDIVTEMESIVEEKESEIQALAEQLNESEKLNIKLNKTLSDKDRLDLIEARCVGLADTAAEKFKDLASELIFEGVESFDKKLQVIRENYFDKKPTNRNSSSFLTEGVTDTVDTTSPIKGNMAVYARALANTI